MVLLAVNQSGVDLTDKDTINVIAVCFMVAYGSIFCVIAGILLQIRSKQDVDNKVTVEKKVPFQAADKAEKETMTYMQYDTAELQKLFTQLIIGVCVTGGTFYKWGYVQPMLFQSILQPITLVSHGLFRIHILGQQEAENEALKRPWKEDRPDAFFEDLKKQIDPDAAAEKDAGKQRKVKGAANKAALKRHKTTTTPQPEQSKKTT